MSDKVLHYNSLGESVEDYDLGNKMKTLRLKIYLTAIKRKIQSLLTPNFNLYGTRSTTLFLSPSQGISISAKHSTRLLNLSQNIQAPDKWQATAREKLIELCGYSRLRPKVEVVMASKTKIYKNSILKSTYYLRVEKCSDVPVHFVHKSFMGTKIPVFIFLSGSTSGVHVGWGEVKVPIDHERIGFGADLLLRAADAGYLGVGIEQAGYGERQEMHLNKKSYNRTVDAFSHLLLQGKSLIGLGASDVSSVIDWLVSEECQFEIDPDHIYLFGHSSGGTLAQYCGAMDKRISGVMASGSVGQIKQTILQRGNPSGDGIVPGILKWFETADVVAMCAPRPFLALSGRNDHIFPFQDTKRVIDEARLIYEELGASSNIHSVEAEGPHRYYGELSWNSWKEFVHRVANN